MEKVLGLTKNDEVFQVNISNDSYASVSFSFSEIARTKDTIKNHDYMRDLFEGIVDCYPKEFLYDECDKYDCPPSKLPDKMAEEALEDSTFAMDYVECSYIPEILEWENQAYIFIASSGGQHDPREEEILDVVDVKLYTDILEYWDKYHLKNIYDNKEALELYNSIVKRMEELDDDITLVDYVELADSRI